jgi:UDP-N-acetylglucosamine:LPS N-acetylglucosamine transferase
MTSCSSVPLRRLPVSTSPPNVYLSGIVAYFAPYYVLRSIPHNYQPVNRGVVPGPIVVVSASIGAGHDGAAAELTRRLRATGLNVQRHDFLDLLPGRLGGWIRLGYATQLRVAPGSWGWLLGTLDHPVLAVLVSWLCVRVSGRRLRAAVGSQPGAVVSTYPLASQALGRMRRSGQLPAPVITYLTDLSVHRLWIANGVDAHIALHQVAALQALRWGAGSISVTSPAVPPGFRPADCAAERRADRMRFGLPEDAPLSLVVAGSWGVGEVDQTVDDINACGVVRVVVACGRNEPLRQRLARSGAAIALGWTDQMPALVRACDVVVQNAGGLSSLEALSSGVPVVSYRCVPGHGLTNAQALDDAGWAVWVHDAAELTTALKRAVTGEDGPPPIHPGADPAAVIAALAGTGRRVPA